MINKQYDTTHIKDKNDYYNHEDPTINPERLSKFINKLSREANVKISEAEKFVKILLEN